MANGHNSIKRIVHRSCEEIGATFRIARVTSWPEAINTFRAKLDIQVMSRNGYKEPPAVKKRLLRKHETVLKYLENRFGDFFESYDYDTPLPSSDPASRGRSGCAGGRARRTRLRLSGRVSTPCAATRANTRSSSSRTRISPTMFISPIGFRQGARGRHVAHPSF